MASRRCVLQVVAAAFFVILVPVVAHASPGSGDLGSGRLLPTVAGLAGLIGVVAGRRALSRARTGTRRAGAVLATVLGLISLGIGALHAANAAGGFGTGNGLAGAIVAMALGLTSTVFGGLALARLRGRE